MYTKSHFGVLLSKPAVKDLFFTLKPGKRRKVIHKIGDPKINSASQKVTMKACVRTKHIRHPHLVTFHTRYQQTIAQIKDQVILRFLCFNTVLNEILLIFCIMEASGSPNPIGLRHSKLQTLLQEVYIQGYQGNGSFNSRVPFMFLFTMSFCMTYSFAFL